MSCYRELKDPVEIDGKEIPLSTIKKTKNDDSIKEGWVQCDGCVRWQHQICALFNQRRHESHEGTDRKYYCPRCLLNELKRAHAASTIIPQPRMRRVADLDQVCAVPCRTLPLLVFL
jgi:E1A/CREB-binding protein